MTLTYDDYHLPPGGSLDKTHFVKFMKRLRKRFGAGIRFFQCGEYGEKFKRPHHHVCLFGFDFKDKIPYSRSPSGCILYYSPTLSELWPYGFNTVGELTVDSAAYTARYVLKKIGRTVDEYDGLQPEYVTMSRRPGIGREWYERYKKDLYTCDTLVVSDDLRLKPPRYYDNLYHIDAPDEYLKLKLKRKQAAENNKDATPKRLAVREHIAKVKLKRKQRNYDGSASLPGEGVPILPILAHI